MAETWYGQDPKCPKCGCNDIKILRALVVLEDADCKCSQCGHEAKGEEFYEKGE